MKFALLLALSLLSLQGIGQEKNRIEIENAWSRATPPGAKLAAGYMTLRNKSGAPDRLVSAASPLARKVETHVTMRDGEILRMREVRGYEIPANGSYELRPGGSHLMLVDIKKPFKDGDKVPLTLRFEKAGEVKIELPVRAAAPGSGGHMNMKMD